MNIIELSVLFPGSDGTERDDDNPDKGNNYKKYSRNKKDGFNLVSHPKKI